MRHDAGFEQHGMHLLPLEKTVVLILSRKLNGTEYSTAPQAPL
jgi:hypothetical protein